MVLLAMIRCPHSIAFIPGYNPQVYQRLVLVGAVPHPKKLPDLPMRFKQPSLLYATETDDELELTSDDERGKGQQQYASGPKVFSWMMVGLPLLSFAFPQLLQLAKSLPPNSGEQLVVVSALFVGNRAYLYAMSATIVALAAWRGAMDSAKLGERITDLTEELLFRPSFAMVTTTEERSSSTTEGSKLPKDREKPAIIQSLSESTGFGKSLDEMPSESQALFLPVLVSSLLALSVFLLPLWNGPNPVIEDQLPSLTLFSKLRDILATILPKISEVWNIGLLTLFTRSEVRRLFFELLPIASTNKETDDSSIRITCEWAIALGITLSAFLLQQWPAQNFVNMALAILVGRAVQLDRFYTIAAALSLLTVYDVASVFLIPAANAAATAAFDPSFIPAATTTSTSLISDATTASSSGAAAGSAMGSVAIQKLTSGTFQPGLLTTRIGNSLGGSLGLGDAVFPSILANFARRYDLVHEHDRHQEENRTSLFAVSMGSYLLGCFACEFAPTISSSGIPALVFIVPIMLGSVLISATVSGELEELLQFEPSNGSSNNE
eukprot:scaffold5887_cov122-Cylindrotheca_fusiformis.AAC.18